MAELVTVYRTLANDVSRVVGYLRSRNLDAVVLDDVGKMTAYRRDVQEVRIAVPATQQDMARGVLAEMDKEDQARLSPTVKTARGVVLLIIIVLAFIGVVGLLDPGGKWFVGAWIVLTAAVAVALIRWAWRKSPRT
ncbi:MAG: hypothetical protein JW741_30305 [Sedimentisphaerales bacterium]|nr:hypothetical protein [Sedimentisphaerales bacterium]